MPKLFCDCPNPLKYLYNCSEPCIHRWIHSAYLKLFIALQGIAILYWLKWTFYFVPYGHPFKAVLSCLFQVRASSLQELVYKGGQAGVTKATVTITFDNSDKQQSPVGYEMYDELTVSRQVLHHCSMCLNNYYNYIIIHIYIYIYILFIPLLFLLFVHTFVGSDWWTKQVPYQWHKCHSITSTGPLSFRSAQRQQPALSHHASMYGCARVWHGTSRLGVTVSHCLPIHCTTDSLSIVCCCHAGPHHQSAEHEATWGMLHHSLYEVILVLWFLNKNSLLVF